jgi:hypothetical protein
MERLQFQKDSDAKKLDFGVNVKSSESHLNIMKDIG